MIKAKNYNNFPDTSPLNVKPLGREETAMFRLMGTFNAAAKKYFLRSELLPSEDLVTDPETSISYHIACIRSVGADDKVIFHEVWFEPSNVCIIRLSGKSAADQEIYKFCKISNFNSSNVNRDPLAPVMFEEVTNETDVILPRVLRKNKRAAFNIIDHLTDAEITAFLKNSREIPSASEELRRNQIEDFAERFPELVLRAGNYSSDDMSRDVDKFIAADLIEWKKEEGVWIDVKTGNTFLKTGKSFGSNTKADVVSYFTNNDDKFFKYQRMLLDMKMEKGEHVVTFDKPAGELIGDQDSEIMTQASQTPKKNPFKKAFVKA